MNISTKTKILEPFFSRKLVWSVKMNYNDTSIRPWYIINDLLPLLEILGSISFSSHLEVQQQSIIWGRALKAPPQDPQSINWLSKIRRIFQISWTLLKTVSFLFWVNFRPKVQHGVPINLFLKTEDILTLSSHSKLSYKKGVRGGFRTLQTSKMELLTILSCQLLTIFAKNSI